MDALKSFFTSLYILIFSPAQGQFLLSSDWTLFWFRIVVGLIFLVHGIQKLHYWKISHVGTISQKYLFLFRVVSFIEIVSSFSLFMGVFVHITALFLIGIMLGALYFKIVIWKKGFTGESGWELDLLMIAALGVLFFFGGGFFSFDRKFIW